MKKYFLFLAMLLLSVISFGQVDVFFENFETQPYKVSSSGNPSWTVATNLYTDGSHSYHNAPGVNQTAYLTTNSFSTSGYVYVRLVFDHICKIEYVDTANVQISVDGGATWITLNSSSYLSDGTLMNNYAFSSLSYINDWQPLTPGATPTNAWWKTEMFDISSIAANKSDVRVRFRLKDQNGNGAGSSAGWYLDKIKVLASSVELNPPTITLLTPIYQDTLTNNPGPYTIKAEVTDETGISQVRLLWRRNNGPLDSVQMINTINNVFEGVIPAQAYNGRIDYYIKAIDNTSAHNQGQITNWFFTKRLLLHTITISETYYNMMNGLPLHAGYKYSYGGMLFRSDEINFHGPIKKISFLINTPAPNVTMNHQYVYMGELPYNSFTSNQLIDTAILTRTKGPFSYTWNGSGWHDIEMSNPYNYTGNNSLYIVWVNKQNTYNSMNWSFYGHNRTNTCLSAYDDNAFPPIPGPGNIQSTRPDIKIVFELPIHTNDIQFISIIEPSGVVYSSNQYNIKGIIKNYGTDTLTNFTIKYSINGVQQPDYYWTGSLLTDQETTVTFATGISFSAGEVLIKAWTQNPNGFTDEYTYDDTAKVVLNCCNAGYAGTYTINSSQATGGSNFNNFNDAFDAISECGLAGPVILEIMDTLINSSITIPTLPNLSPINTLTIKPHVGTYVTLKSDTSDYTIRFLATHNVILDGSDGTGSILLTVKHSKSSGSVAPILVSSTDNIASKSITIKNVNIESGHNSSDAKGIFIGGTTSSTQGKGNDSIVITNVNIQKAYYGIYSWGTSDNPNTRIFITNNTIGSNIQNKLISYTGVYLLYNENVKINNNHIFNIKTINNSPKGIYSLGENVNVEIKNNNIHSIWYNGTGSYAGQGIYLSNTNNNTNTIIANNMISDIGGKGDANVNTISGITISGTTGGVSIYFNSINLFGSYSNTNPVYTTGIYVNLNATNIDLRNNIISNSMINTSNNSSKSYALYSSANVSAYTYIDYNDYFAYGSQAVLAYMNFLDRLTLASLQAASGQDEHSIVTNPNFFTPIDLHTDEFSLYGVGTPIPNITTDFDGDPRDTDNPSIGADELILYPSNLKLYSLVSPQIDNCGLTNNENIKFKVINLGANNVTSFQATYIINGNTPVTQTFTGNLAFLDTLLCTFTVPADFSSNGNYNFTLFVSILNDADLDNDTIRTIISNGHNFASGPYTMSFEPNEPYNLWSYVDLGNDGYSWEFPNYDIANAHSGSYSAKFNNGTSNNNKDWLFTRCFNLSSSELYEITYWYKASSTTSNHSFYVVYGNSPAPNNLTYIDTINNINNTNYVMATVRFSVPTNGIYYIGWGMNSSANINALYLDDINIKMVAPYDVSLDNVLSPVTDCGLGEMNITVQGKNMGSAPVSNIPISYSVNNSPTVITEIYNNTVNPGETFTHTFSTLENFAATTNDINFTITAWTSLNNDVIYYNDTVVYHFTSRLSPQPPLVYSQTILVDTSATLTAYTPNGTIALWYADQLGNSLLHIGNQYTTPILQDTTVYYVASKFVKPEAIIGDMNSQDEIDYAPIYGQYNYSYAGMIYLSNEIGQSGLIDTISFYVNNMSNSIFYNQKIYMSETYLSSYESYEIPDTLQMQMVYNGNIEINNYGWVKIPLQVPFDYSGGQNLHIFWRNNNGFSSSNYPIFKATSFEDPRLIVNASNNVNDLYSNASLDNNLPNLRISWNTCQSSLTPDTVYVVDSAPYELSISEILYPKDCAFPNTNISIRLRNDGDQSIPAGINLTCIVNGTTISGTTTDPILAHSSLDYTFTTPININFINNQATLNIKVYHNAPQYSLTVFNDTLEINKNVFQQASDPIVHNFTTANGLPAVLTADPQPGFIHMWFEDELANNFLTIGDTLITPPLFDTTVYYIRSLGISNSYFVGDTNTSITSYDLPVNGTYEYSFGSSIYLAEEIGARGYIDTLSYFLTDVYSDFTLSNQKIFIKETSLNEHISTSMPDTTDMTKVFDGTILLSGEGWQKIALQNPFYYSGENNLQIVWVSNSGTFQSYYVTFLVTPVNTNRGLSTYSSYLPLSDGTLYSYIPNIKFNIRHCPSNLVPDTAFVISPSYELGISDILVPLNDNCYDNNVNISVRLTNNGTMQIPAGVSLSCVYNGSNTINATTTEPILPNSYLDFTFSTPIFVNYINKKAEINLKIYHSAPIYSLVTFNDTITANITLKQKPIPPTVQSDTVIYNSPATLVANSQDNFPIGWSSDSLGNNIIYVGNNFVTPPLTDTTVYYAATYNSNNTIIGNMNSASTSYEIPFNGWYDYNYSSMIYLSSEIGGASYIDTIAFYVADGPSDYIVNNQKIYMKEVTYNQHTSYNLPDTNSMQRVFVGDINFNGTGWQKIVLQHPFSYSGNNNLQIVWLNYDGSYSSPYPKFLVTDVSGNRGLYKHQDGSFPQTPGNYATYVPNIMLPVFDCSSDLVADTAYVVVPPYELELSELLYPINNECTPSNVNVSVKLKNNGNSTIPTGVGIRCILNGSTTIDGYTTTPILPQGSIIFTFPSTIAIPFVNGIANVNFKIYPINNTYSPVPINDTINENIFLKLDPANPVVDPVTINYGYSTTLNAILQDNIPIYWFADPNGNNLLHIGNSYTTPILYDTTTYYVAAIGSAKKIIGNVNSSTTSTYLPAYGFYNYSYSSMIYLNSEINGGGLIDSIGVYVASGSNNYIMNNQKIYFKEISETSHISTAYPDITTMSLVYDGTVTFNSSGLHKIGLTHPFNYSGSNNLQIVWLNYDGTWSSGYPYFVQTTVTGNRGLYNYSDAGMPTTSGTFASYVPTLWMNISGCTSDTIPVYVNVANIPTIDIGVSDISLPPDTGIELSNAETVKIIIKNYRPDDLNNVTFDVAYVLNDTVTVIEQFSGNIPANDTVSYVFSQPADLSFIGTHKLKAYTDLSTDEFHLNDTLTKFVINKLAPYCTSTAIYPDYMDICRVKIGNFENYSTFSNALYTDFTTINPIVLSQGQNLDLEIDVCDGGTNYYDSYVRVFIDWDQNGQYDVPNEIAYESLVPAGSSITISGDISVPDDAILGFTGVRVVVMRGTTPPNPCTTYNYGETEDYMAYIMPPSDFDAAITNVEIDYMQYVNTTAEAILKINNFGLNPITSFNIISEHNGLIVDTIQWNGTLLPDTFVIVNVSDIPVSYQNNTICFTVEALQDDVAFNNSKCKDYYGLPSVVIFEDNMDGSTQLVGDDSGLWEHGEPQGTIIDEAHSSPNVWMTKLAEPYPDNTQGFLNFPILNLATVTDPYLSFYYWVESEPNYDGAYIQYSLNNGTTWQTLGNISDPNGYNWYNSTLSNGLKAFSGSSGKWMPAFLKMSELSNKANVRLRIGFYSDAAINNDGFAIDDIKITTDNLPNNVALVDIISPTSPTTTGSAQHVTVKIANVGSNAVTNVPVGYKLNTSNTAVLETYNGSINPGDTVTYTFNNTFVAPHIDYMLCAFTRLSIDQINNNDTLCININSLPANYDVGVIQILSPVDSTLVGQPLSVKVVIKNFGTNAVSNIPIRYQLNYANDREDIINETINPGDTIHFTFSEEYIGPTIQYVLCAETMLPNDEYEQNNAICVTMGTYVGIDELTLNNDIIVYPNPSTGEFILKINANASVDANITVRNILGEIVYSENILLTESTNKIKLDLNNQASGVYYCSIKILDKIYNVLLNIQK